MLRKYNQVKREVKLYEEMAMYPYQESIENFGGSRSVAVVPYSQQDAYIAKMDIPAVQCRRELIRKVELFRDQLEDENELSVLELRYLSAEKIKTVNFDTLHVVILIGLPFMVTAIRI